MSYSVPPNDGSPTVAHQPPAQWQIVRYCLLTLGTVLMIPVYAMLVFEGLDAIGEDGVLGYLRFTWSRVDHRAAYGALPFGLVSLILLWRDRHVLGHPRRATDRATTIGYRILWGIGLLTFIMFGLSLLGPT